MVVTLCLIGAAAALSLRAALRVQAASTVVTGARLTQVQEAVAELHVTDRELAAALAAREHR